MFDNEELEILEALNNDKLVKSYDGFDGDKRKIKRYWHSLPNYYKFFGS